MWSGYGFDPEEDDGSFRYGCLNWFLSYWRYVFAGVFGLVSLYLSCF